MERRRYSRRRSYLGARLVFGNKDRAIDCLVRDISPAGARIVLPRTDIVPETFDIFFTERRCTIRARRIWNDPGDLGAVFLDQDGYFGSLAAENERIHQLSADNAARARLSS